MGIYGIEELSNKEICLGSGMEARTSVVLGSVCPICNKVVGGIFKEEPKILPKHYR